MSLTGRSTAAQRLRRPMSRCPAASLTTLMNPCSQRRPLNHKTCLAPYPRLEGDPPKLGKTTA